MSAAPTPAPTVAPTLAPTVAEIMLAAEFQSFATGFAVLFLVFALYLTLSMARAELKSQIDSLRKDPFRQPDIGQNWNWDYIMVFPVFDDQVEHTEGMRAEDKKFARDNTLKKVIAKLAQGGLETTCFYSRDRSMIFVKIRASKDRLQREADRIDYKLRLDEREIQLRMAEGEKEEDGEWRWLPRAYNDTTRAALEDGPYQEANYFKGSTLRQRFEYVTLRSEDKEYADSPEGEKPEVGKIYPIADVMQQSTIPWYKFIYGKYDQDEDMQALYAVDPKTGCQFRSVDRLKLMRTIFEARAADSGCGLDTGKMMERGCVLGIFPLHNENDLIGMERGFMEFATWPWAHNLDDLKDYFGEKIGLYFTYLTHYTSWLLYSCVLGIAVHIMIVYIQYQRASADDDEVYKSQNDPDVFLVPYYCVLMTVWSTLYLEDWKRKQIETAMCWGTVGCEETETERPEFMANKENIEINSPVSGDLTMYFPPNVKRNREYLSLSIIGISILIVAVAVCGVFVFKAWTTSASIGSLLSIPGDYTGGEPFELGPHIATAANVINIFIGNAIYSSLAAWMNDNENHRTDTEFEDALIFKTFMFQFCNSYGALAYIAFMKDPVFFRGFGPEDDYRDSEQGTFDNIDDWETKALSGIEAIGYNSQCEGSCMSELAGQLFTIFVFKVIIANAKEVVVPYLKIRKAHMAENAGGEDEEHAEYENPEDPREKKKRMRSLVEIEFDKEEYDELQGPFDDYAEMVIQFGYATLFVAAYPLAPLMAFANNYVEIRVDMWKLGQNSRRPVPSNAEDIGTWQSVLETMSTLSVISNSAMVCFTGGFLQGYKTWGRFAFFIFMEHGIILLKTALALAVPDVPDHVQIQLDRNEFIVEKLIEHCEDDIELDEVDNDEKTEEALTMPDSTDTDTVLISHMKEWDRADERERKAKADQTAASEETKE